MPQPLQQKVEAGRQVRAVGIDDAPFERRRGAVVPLAGVVCSATRLEGLVWGHAHRDGDDATAAIERMLLGSKFLPQLDLLMVDGLTVGGLNVIDLRHLHEVLQIPCVAVMRRPPDLDAVRAALQRVADPDVRWATLQRAGDVHELGGFVFQHVGDTPAGIAAALGAVTDRGRVPEPLRLAHLIGAGVVRGESGRRA
jgi:endonuclease V-like protein UPF0215 family